MWGAIVEFFKNIDAGLTSIENYLDNRVRTGKWVGDVKSNVEDSEKNSINALHKIRRSRPMKLFLALVFRVWDRLHVIPAVAKSADLIVETYSIIKYFYVEILICLQLSFLSTVILFNLFISSPIIFSLVFMPTLFVNSFIFSALYYAIEARKTSDKKIPIAEAFRAALQAFPSLSFIILIHIITSLIFIVGVYLFSVLYSQILISLKIIWEDLFGYWVIVIPLILLLLTVLFYFSITMYQAYFITLFEKKGIFAAFKQSRRLIKENGTWYYFFYLLFTLSFFHFMYWLSFTFFPLGLIASLFLFGHIFLFLGYLLRRKLHYTPDPSNEPGSIEERTLLTFFVILGLISYGATTTLIVDRHNRILTSMDNLNEQFRTGQQLTPYTSPRYGYSINYPKSWTVNEENDNSTTFYNNDTHTPNGGIWINIKVLPFSKKEFYSMYERRPGLAFFETVTQDVTTKTTNLLIENKYEAVKYTTIKDGRPTKYTTHYLIHKDDLMIDITFLTFNRDIEGKNLQLFQAIIDSFTFNE